MIRIFFKNGNIDKWKKEKYTDYKYDGRCFIIMRKSQWIGIYNLDDISAITVGE